MDKSMLIGGIFGAVAVTAVGSYAGYNYLGKSPQYADVLSVTPVVETYFTDREECYDEVVQQQAAVKDKNQIAGTVIGAVIGGVLGNQVGGGSGKKVATVAGAAAGGYAGKKVQQQQQANDVVTTTERRCQVVQDKHEKITGYEVEYSLDGEIGTVTMDDKPSGNTIPVSNGQLVLNALTPDAS
ncbi:glycine zipper 2TM domain-containing protein [Spongiibacter taiwanensis]|uniref:glycine zipper 2TM domain-containing protein n=1 Tax=Spongiibacter taiwanensis TaxID=1748242 RepID=UPI002035EBD3|nr:glycine zipper 2TM domain-containing protein [Spongiibacter taiwanensis]USA41910.1 glycine zipper 2TM domain-containing protein [Spongiibacter taiwanensis]